MDGAIRFTQRDALAAVLITGVNIVAGLIIGVLQHDLDVATAAQTYTILTVGEGLVTSIPSLLVSMSGGLITTRAASESNLGDDVAVQLLARSRPLAVAAAVLLGLALIPGLPKFSFLFVAAILGAAAYVNRSAIDTPKAEAEKAAQAALAGASPDALDPATTVDALSVEVGYALVSLVDEKQGARCSTGFSAMPGRCANETGIVVPSVHVADNLQLPPRVLHQSWSRGSRWRGASCMRTACWPSTRVVSAPRSRVCRRVNRRSVCPPTWIPQEHREKAAQAGFTVVDPTTALSTHLLGDNPDLPAGPPEPSRPS